MHVLLVMLLLLLPLFSGLGISFGECLEKEITFNEKAGGKDDVLGNAYERAAWLLRGIGFPASQWKQSGMKPALLEWMQWTGGEE